MMGVTDAAPKKDSSQYGGLKPLRTYQGDVSEVMGKTKASVVSIAVAEQKRKTRIEPPPKIETDVGTKNKFYISAGITLFLLGILVVGVFWYIGTQNKTVQVAESSTILNYDKEIDIVTAGLSRAALVSKISDAENNFNSPVNSVLYINTGEKNAPDNVQTVLVTLAPQIPPELLRNLSDSYMFGVYSFDKNQPFVILTVDDFGIGWSGMLKWEKTMISDLGGIFGIASSSAPATGFAFSDEGLNNKDLRVVHNSGRQTVLLYSFLDKNTVLITTNENTFNALLNKYLTGKMVK
jgi:hypothetical protein